MDGMVFAVGAAAFVAGSTMCCLCCIEIEKVEMTAVAKAAVLMLVHCACHLDMKKAGAMELGKV